MMPLVMSDRLDDFVAGLDTVLVGIGTGSNMQQLWLARCWRSSDRITQVWFTRREQANGACSVVCRQIRQDAINKLSQNNLGGYDE